MSEKVNAAADIEKELAERVSELIDNMDSDWSNAYDLILGFVKGALLAEAGERAKLEAQRDDWKHKAENAAKQCCDEIAINDGLIASAETAEAQVEQLCGDVKTIQQDYADAAERARGLEAQLELVRKAWQEFMPEAGHWLGCAGNPCDCGRDMMLAALSQLPTPKKV